MKVFKGSRESRTLDLQFTKTGALTNWAMEPVRKLSHVYISITLSLCQQIMNLGEKGFEESLPITYQSYLD